MLVLTRKTGQKLIIDNQIEVTVLEVKGDAVKIGINAPKHIAIFREEIFEEIKKANQDASQGSRTTQSTDLDAAMKLMGTEIKKKQ